MGRWDRSAKNAVRVILALWFVFLGSCQSTPRPDTESPPGGPNPPEIVDAFATAGFPAGGIWRIYIEGRDPDGDMDRIYFRVSQLGGNMWSQHFVDLRGADRDAFSGYVAMPIRLPPMTSRQRVKLEVKIRDAADHYSEEWVHSAIIGVAVSESVPQKWAEAAHHQLGTIFFRFELEEDDSPPFRRFP